MSAKQCVSKSIWVSFKAFSASSAASEKFCLLLASWDRNLTSDLQLTCINACFSTSYSICKSCFLYNSSASSKSFFLIWYSKTFCNASLSDISCSSKKSIATSLQDPSTSRILLRKLFTTSLDASSSDLINIAIFILPTA